MDDAHNTVAQLQLVMHKQKSSGTPTKCSPVTDTRETFDTLSDSPGSLSDLDPHAGLNEQISALKQELIAAQTHSLEHKMARAHAEERLSTAEAKADEWERMLEDTQDELDELHDVLKLQEELESETELREAELAARVRELDSQLVAMNLENEVLRQFRESHLAENSEHVHTQLARRLKETQDELYQCQSDLLAAKAECKIIRRRASVDNSLKPMSLSPPLEERESRAVELHLEAMHQEERIEQLERALGAARKEAMR